MIRSDEVPKAAFASSLNTKLFALLSNVIFAAAPVKVTSSLKTDVEDTSRLPFKSNCVAVTIPVRLIEGTSNAPNNLPFNTKSPLIV